MPVVYDDEKYEKMAKILESQPDYLATSIALAD